MRRASSELKKAGIRRWGTRLRRVWAMGVLIGGAVACGDGGPAGPEISADVEEFVSLVNSYRVTVGCAPLEWDRRVADVAEGHSKDMVARDFFSHTNPDGDSPWDRLSAAGISFKLAAENIAWGYTSAEAVLNGWLGSPGHRANIENCALTHHGVGLADWHWTHLFVTP
jgi:uncharacterized protein YkwD